MAALAEELRAVWAAVNSADERCLRLKDGPESARARTEHEHLQDRAYTLEEAITQRRATSPEGVLMQLALAAEEAGALADYGTDKHATRVEQHRRQVQRLLHSAASAVERLQPASAPSF